MGFRIRSLIIVFLLLGASQIHAQPGGGPPPPPGEPVPVSGLELLLASGAILGASKLLQKKIKKVS